MPLHRPNFSEDRSVTPRFIFDECFAKPAMIGLGEFLSKLPDPPELKHISDFRLNGIRDENWIPSFAKQGWITITTDGGKGGSKKGKKLPRVCHAHKMTHVILSPQLHGQPVKTKILSVASAWEQIVKLHEEPPGSRFSLRMNQAKTGILLVKIELTDTGFPVSSRRHREAP